MRTLLTLLLVAGLLAAPLALAARDGHGPETAAEKSKPRETREANDDDDNETGRALGHARQNETADAGHGRGKWSVWVEARRAWHDGTQDVRERCHAAAPLEENATKEARMERAHCIQSGYRAMLETVVAMLTSWRAAHAPPA